MIKDGRETSHLPRYCLCGPVWPAAATWAGLPGAQTRMPASLRVRRSAPGTGIKLPPRTSGRGNRVAHHDMLVTVGMTRSPASRDRPTRASSTKPGFMLSVTWPRLTRKGPGSRVRFDSGAGGRRPICPNETGLGQTHPFEW